MDDNCGTCNTINHQTKRRQWPEKHEQFNIVSFFLLVSFQIESNICLLFLFILFLCSISIALHFYCHLIYTTLFTLFNSLDILFLLHLLFTIVSPRISSIFSIVVDGDLKPEKRRLQKCRKSSSRSCLAALLWVLWVVRAEQTIFTLFVVVRSAPKYISLFVFHVGKYL